MLPSDINEDGTLKTKVQQSYTLDESNGGFMKKYGWWMLLVLLVAGGLVYWLWPVTEEAPKSGTINRPADILLSDEIERLKSENAALKQQQEQEAKPKELTSEEIAAKKRKAQEQRDRRKAEQAKREVAELNRKEKADQARRELLAAEERAKKACGVLGYTPRAGGKFSCNQPPVEKVVTPVSPKQSVACGDRLVWTEVAQNDWKCLPVVLQPAPVAFVAPTPPQVAPPVDDCRGKKVQPDGSVWCLEEVPVQKKEHPGLLAGAGSALLGGVIGYVIDPSGGGVRGALAGGLCGWGFNRDGDSGSAVSCGVVGGVLGGLVNKGDGGGGSSGAGQPVESPVPSGPVESPI
ncbi:MAG: hypothetical protein AAB552_02810 [Patescibacteria group bacterium]